MQSSVIFSQVYPNRVRGYNEIEEVEYGEYPQMAADKRMQRILESEYRKGMSKTGRTYTFDSTRYDDYDAKFNPVVYEEYEYQGKKYIRIKANSCFGDKFKLSNDCEYKNGDYVWVEVSPVKWIIDDVTNNLIAKKGLVSGIRYHEKNSKYDGDFSQTEMNVYLGSYMAHDLFQNAILTNTEILSSEEKNKKMDFNPYGLSFEQVSEEQIIRGAVESSVPVFLHGLSSDGKSSRVKQIDPTCEIIYLCNSSPESLNGRSVYNQATGEMIDIEPTWLKRLKAKCENEPNRLHIVFFDELTNALPSIQSSAFNIVLDREVNGIWKLPENARIVAAGNEMSDSISANQLAEPLFNRFAHVYIKTTVEGWLKWASENGIHPAIYTYIAYKNGSVLRSKYDGEKPNADPRKWEMASKMLYKTGHPEMLRSLIGEELTREFIQFCRQPIININDVIEGNYNENDIKYMDTASRYLTAMGLSLVNDENLDKIRKFVAQFDAEIVAVFESLWMHGDEKRAERIMEIRLAEASKGGVSK